LANYSISDQKKLFGDFARAARDGSDRPFYASDAVTNLFHSTRGVVAPRISGEWITPLLTNPYNDAEHFHLSFELKSRGNNLGGFVRDTNEDGPLKGESFDYPILDGKIDRDVFSFHTNFRLVGDTKEYSEFYEGRAVDDRIAFRRWNDVGGGSTAIETFLAKRPPEWR
jgi:hypothetical protein